MTFAYDACCYSVAQQESLTNPNGGTIRSDSEGDGNYRQKGSDKSDKRGQGSYFLYFLLEITVFIRISRCMVNNKPDPLADPCLPWVAHYKHTLRHA